MDGWDGPASWGQFRDFQREVGRLLAPGMWLVPRGVPPINLYEVGNQYVLTTPLAGMGPDEVELSITGEILTIHGARKRLDGVAAESYRRQERVVGRWTRTITLPGRVATDDIAASFAHGILTVTIPRAEPAQPRQITVTSVITPPPAMEV